MAKDVGQASEQVLSPAAFVHVVLKTNNFRLLVDFYKKFLGAHSAYENDFAAFLSYDEEHHRVAIVKVPGDTPKTHSPCGLEHMAFAFKTLDDLFKAYQQRKRLGITPVWCVNHGPTTSMYYKDPDGNKIETQVDNFDSADEANDFMMSKEFAENPIGTDFDPEDHIARLWRGEDHASIKKRVEIGPRGIPDHLGV
jgi:catechol-2,3-dioxygenase